MAEKHDIQLPCMALRLKSTNTNKYFEVCFSKSGVYK